MKKSKVGGQQTQGTPGNTDKEHWKSRGAGQSSVLGLLVDEEPLHGTGNL